MSCRCNNYSNGNYSGCNGCSNGYDDFYNSACVSQWLNDNQRDCIRTIPSGRSEALNRGNHSCSCSGIVYYSGCCSCGR